MNSFLLMWRGSRHWSVPVCLDIDKTPIFSCQQQHHLVCFKCRPRLTSCLECREDYQGQLRRHRYAERDAEELEKNVWRACQVDQLVTTKESSIHNTHEENMNQQEHFPLTLKIKKLKSRIVLKLMLHWFFTLISIKKIRFESQYLPFYLIDTVQSAAELQTFRHDQEGRPVSLSLSLSLQLTLL